MQYVGIYKAANAYAYVKLLDEGRYHIHKIDYCIHMDINGAGSVWVSIGKQQNTLKYPDALFVFHAGYQATDPDDHVNGTHIVNRKHGPLYLNVMGSDPDLNVAVSVLIHYDEII